VGDLIDTGIGVDSWNNQVGVICVFENEVPDSQNGEYTEEI